MAYRPKRTNRSTPQAFKRLSEHRIDTQFAQLFEHLPDAHQFVKDRQGRFLHANRALLERLGMKHVEQIVGTTDHDRYPPYLADRFAATDRQVIETGRPLIDHADILYDATGALAWFCTNKYPLRDGRGRVVGVMGVTRTRPNAGRVPQSNDLINDAIGLIESDRVGSMTVEALAEQLAVSTRTLHRMFRDALGMSAQEFMLRSRVQSAAAELGESDRPIAEIAQRHGFCDQSAFTRQFRRRLGQPPRAYRVKYRS